MRDQPRRKMRATRWLVLGVVISLLPLPWLQGGLRHGTSRELALVIDGDPAVTRTEMRYLTVQGYYPLGQALLDQLVGGPDGPPPDLLRLERPDWLRPLVNEPVAAALGIEAAGGRASAWLWMEGRDAAGQQVRVDRFNGRPIRAANDLVAARGLSPDGGPWFSTFDGRRFDGPPSDTLNRVQLRWRTSTEAHTTGGVPFGHVAALREPVRGMPVGASHTLIVALAAYEHTSGAALLPDRRLAATGALDPSTGAVGRVGGLALKAAAAHADGVDVLLYPAAQRGELDGVRTPGMLRVPVASLDEAISVLDQLRAAGRPHAL